MQRSSLISFLTKNNCLLRHSNASTQLTHTLMDGAGGGKISLPDEIIDGFFDAYGQDLLRKQKLYVIERRTPIFKLHFDLDLTQLHSDAKTRELLQRMRSAVERFYPVPEREETSWAVCCAVLDEQRQRRAKGLHVVFPWLLVNDEQALWIRALMVSTLRAELPQLEADWEIVVDVQVLTSNGMRMVGSDKSKPCPECRNVRDAREFCSHCSRQGRIAEDKIYVPWLCEPPEEGLLRDLLGNLPHAVRMCSTRVPSSKQLATPGFLVPAGAPPSSRCRKLPQNEARDGQTHQLCEQAATPMRLRLESVPLTEELRAALKETLANHHSSYAQLDIAQLERLTSARRPTFSVRVRGFGCRFCQNRGAEHTTQTVYFILTDRGAVQRCYSRKQVSRKHGFCDKFASASTPILPRLMELLFPEARPVLPIAEEHEQKAAKRSGIDLAELLFGVGRR